MEQIIKNIFIIEDDTLKANVFILLRDDGYCLIDTGIFMKTKHLIQILEDNGFPISDLKMIILTHCHCDHIGGAAELVRRSGAKLAAHMDDVPFILQQDVIEGTYHDLMLEEQKYMRQFGCVVQRIDRVLQDGDMIDDLQVISVPGHTPGSIALYQAEERVMFFGDVIRNNKKNGLVIGVPEKFNSDTEQVHVDARKLLGYPIEHALFGHGSPIVKDAGRILMTIELSSNP